MENNEIVARAITTLNTAEFGSDAFDVAAWAAYHAMSGAQRDVLRQLLFHGPVWDGDICSKAARGDLFDLGLAVRCCFKGEQGYTAASYLAYTVYTASGEDRQSCPPATSDNRISMVERNSDVRRQRAAAPL